MTTRGMAKVQEESNQGSVEAFDYTDMVQGLRKVFATGKTKDIEWRRHQLNQIKKMYLENYQDMIQACKNDLGGSELRGLFECGTDPIQEAIDNLDEWTKDEEMKHKEFFGKSVVRNTPKGVCLIIAPWNFPMNLAFLPLEAAITAGNCVVLKPSEVSSHSAALITKLIPKYLDSECIKVVNGAVAETTALLAQKWNHIFYTGNGAVGRIVMSAAAKHLTPITLELGGKSPCFVDKDAKMDMAVERVISGKFMNIGQICVAPDTILVHESVFDEFLKKLQTRITAWFGKDAKKNPDYGRMINARHAERVVGLAKNASGTVISLCTPNDVFQDFDGDYVPPTIVVEPALHDNIMVEEIFGPVLLVKKVANVDEAIVIHRQVCSEPLALYVFSENQAVIEKFLHNTNSGGACVNSTVEQVASHLPFGGFGESGMGNYHGKAGFLEFSHRRSIYYKDTTFIRGPLIPPPPYPPAMINIVTKLSVTGFVSGEQKRALKIAGLLLAAGVGYKTFVSKI